jgi:hypothetical protein
VAISESLRLKRVYNATFFPVECCFSHWGSGKQCTIACENVLLCIIILGGSVNYCHGYANWGGGYLKQTVGVLFKMHVALG